MNNPNNHPVTHEGEFGTRNGEFGTHKKINENQDSNEQGNPKDLSNHILHMISEDNKVSRKKMAEQLAISERTVQRILNTLPLIHFVGKGKNGHWELTEKE